MIEKEGKKGQVTIFIIIAILIVAIIALIFLYYPKLFPARGTDSQNPVGYMQECIEDELEENIQIIKSQGGNFVPNDKTGYFYKKTEDEEGTYVRYLCYTDDAFTLPCVNQEPFLTEHVEAEILSSINESIEECFESMIRSYENKGYEVDLERGESYVEILPRIIKTNLNSTLDLKKTEESKTYRNFNIDMESSLYELLEVSKNILIWEMNVGDSIPEAYMYDNPYIRVEKHRKSNEAKIYLITDINTEEEFRFAVRSLVYI